MHVDHHAVEKQPYFMVEGNDGGLYLGWLTGHLENLPSRIL